jgi:hypothetical protein
MWSPIDDWYREDVPERGRTLEREQPITQEGAFNNSGTGTRIVMRNPAQDFIDPRNVRVKRFLEDTYRLSAHSEGALLRVSHA